MTPETAAEKARGHAGRPPASFLGWEVITEPDTPNAEQWVVVADLAAGLIHEDRTLYLRSETSGEVISTGFSGLRDAKVRCYVINSNGHLMIEASIHAAF